MRDLDALANDIAEWRERLFSLPLGARLVMFEAAADEVARHYRGLGRIVLGDKLEELALQIGGGLDDVNARQRIMATAIQKAGNGLDPSPGSGPGKDRAGRFKLIPFSELRPKTSSNYLIKELIPSTGLVAVWGAPKCFKSFLAFDVGMHIALGWKYRGRRIRQGTVVYCAFEGAAGFNNRAEAFRRHHDVADDVPFFLMPARINLIAEHTDLIASIAAQSTTPAAVFLDTLNRSLVGSESNDQDMAAYLKAADAIREAFGCVVIIIHHCGIDGTRPRGHTSLPGACEAQLAVKRDGNTAVVTVEYMKDGPEGDQITSHMEPVKVGMDEDGDEMWSMVVRPADDAAAAATKTKARFPPLARKFLEALYDAIREAKTMSMHGYPAATIEHWRAKCGKHGLFDGEAMDPRNRALFSKYRREYLMAGNYIGCDATMAWTLTRESNAASEAGEQLAAKDPLKVVGDCPPIWTCAQCGEDGNDEKGPIQKIALNRVGATAQPLHLGCATKWFRCDLEEP